MTRKLQAQGLFYRSYWIVAIADGAYFTPTILTSHGTLLGDRQCYTSAMDAIVAGQNLVDQQMYEAVPEELRWVD
ncbi:hypothetical protein BST81_14705 [Leptolyngbya sp. 'hensonii']|uniref:hypothetical protein n=1 Tax=Leptolyngbya sp. 'hensonii' TaxID=1922337 RepID=UPI00094FDDF8|nr:hypothetical protein [Leptolyngbya sp. 'hensonii']OLP17576.1 hypothetical protein BST81_14705 [Leptolyngbya sp. 'hensonii']